MPELPEIETVKRSLEPLLIGRSILETELRRPEVVKHPPDGAAFAAALVGQAVACLSRRGKYLTLHLEDGARLTVHLRMTGRLLYTQPDTAEPPHTHVVFRLDNGCLLRFADVRRFGCLWLAMPGEADDFTGISRLGPEPLSEDFSAAYLAGQLRGRQRNLKQAILDQSVIAGLGNIYADEALFVARLLPQRVCADLRQEEWQALAEAIREVLAKAVERRGTTLSDYLDGEGRAGENQHYLQVYQRAGLVCPRCGGLIEKTRLGGRGTSYCPGCQV